MKVLLVAAPLEGRSGVYRTTYDLVNEARSRGLEWSAIIGMRRSAPARTVGPVEGVVEVDIEQHGFAGVREIRDILSGSEHFAAAESVVTLITQSDLAVSGMSRSDSQSWVAYLRGLPWPSPGEQNLLRRHAQRHAEMRALGRADEVWATTTVLANEVALRKPPVLVPAGVPADPRTHFGGLNGEARAVWAGRFAVDKQPQLFVEAARMSGVPSTMFGAGALEDVIRTATAQNTSVAGWVHPDRLWENAAFFVGTSYREAFGRSAVEAALRGVPILIGSAYGAAPLLVRDKDLRRELVLDADNARRWAGAMTELWTNAELRRAASDHVHTNALELTIGASVDRIVSRLRSIRGS